jgi:predicted TIM-barrel fold metal-dependent hydrolase
MPAADCHAHVFDLRRFPLQESRGFDMQPNEHGTVSDYVAVLDTHGISHALLVNPFGGYGTDNCCMLTAIAEHPGRFKGIALLPADATERQIKAMIDGGVVGIRFNLNFENSPSLYGKAGERALAIAKDVGWLVQIHYEGETIVPALPVLRTSGQTVVVDHFGPAGPRSRRRSARFCGAAGTRTRRCGRQTIGGLSIIPDGRRLSRPRSVRRCC